MCEPHHQPRHLGPWAKARRADASPRRWKAPSSPTAAARDACRAAAPTPCKPCATTCSKGRPRCQADRRFHLAVAEMSGNLVLRWTSWSGFDGRQPALQPDERPRRVAPLGRCGEHEAIVRALSPRPAGCRRRDERPPAPPSHGRWLKPSRCRAETPHEATRSCSSPFSRVWPHTPPTSPPRCTASSPATRPSSSPRNRQVLPRSHQVDWMRLERTFFLHFGVNTFNGVEWGSGRGRFCSSTPAASMPGSGCAASSCWTADARAGGQAPRRLLDVAHAIRRTPARTPLHPSLARRQRATWCAGGLNAAREAGVKFAVTSSRLKGLYQLSTNPKNPTPPLRQRQRQAPTTIPLTRRNSADPSAAAPHQRFWRLPLRGR